MRHLSSKLHGKMIKCGLLMAPFVLALWSTAEALEIPLKSTSGGGISVGYVDMDLVFQEYPETKKAKNEYYTELTKRRDDLAKKEQELTSLRQRIAVLQGTLSESNVSTPVPASTSTVPASPSVPPTNVNSTGGGLPYSPSSLLNGDAGASLNNTPPLSQAAPLTTAPPSVSSSSVAAANASVLDRKRELMQKEQELEQARIEAAKAVKDLEETRSLQILGKLYNALVQLAEENNISLVVDKSSILYGQQAIDLTDKLSRRIRGLPESDEMGK